MQRFVQRFLPASTVSMILGFFNSIWNIGDNEIQLRNHLQIQNPHSNLVRLDIFPLYNFPKLWQLFPDEQIKIVLKTSEFDRKLNHYFINDLSDTIDFYVPPARRAECENQVKSSCSESHSGSGLSFLS